MFYDINYLLNNKQFVKVIDEHIYSWIDEYITGKVMTLPKKVLSGNKSVNNTINLCNEDNLKLKMNHFIDKPTKDKLPFNPSKYWNTCEVGKFARQKDGLMWTDLDFDTKTDKLMNPIITELKKYWTSVELRNQLAWYKPKNYMGWHTNCMYKWTIDNKGVHKVIKDDYRLYFIWCDEDKKSFFRWRNPDTGVIHTKWEKKGWNINWFKIGDCDNPTWHCIYSDCNRFSIGFRVLEPHNKVLSAIQEG